ncbi:MAG TPA: hypothetical protein VGD78_03955 [Chthoniobacterales bacterium]
MNNTENTIITPDLSKAESFVFEVRFEAAANQGAEAFSVGGRSVVVAVEATGLVDASAITADPADAARREAEALACRAALQTVQKELPDGVEPACLPSRMDHLPDGLQGKDPTLRTSPASTWLL